MKINKVKSNSYSGVNTACLLDYIRTHTNNIREIVEPDEDGTGNSYTLLCKRFENADKAQLKIIASELETVYKRLEYTIYGRY
jgi:hypothetical protein